MYPEIILHKGKETSLERRHPWVFSGAIKTRDAWITDGTVAEVFSAGGKFLGTGFFSNGSIAVRIISFERTTIDQGFWDRTIARAWDYRKTLQLLDAQTTCCRMFFGEGDGVPGLVIDYYDGHVVLQSHTPGVYLLRSQIATAIGNVLGSALKSIYDKSAETLHKQVSTATNQFLYGQADEVIVMEHGHRFSIDFVRGQKTGFFLDQRENRLLLARYAKGRKVLNTFSYTGGFSVYAGKADALQVDSVDVSVPAIEACNRNVALNGLQNHNGFAVDTFEYLKDTKDKYDLIVLDPPAFAKHRDSRHQAVIGYKRLNAMAMTNIRKGGILFTFSCSGVVDKHLFYNTITAAAMESRREVKILGYLSQPADHPVLPGFPEGEYLKGMVLWIG